MIRGDFVPFEQILDDQLHDPEFRHEWDKTAFARDVAVQVVKYRADHDLTQTQLAHAIGVKQPVVARLECGDHKPTIATLARITAGTGLEFHLYVNHGVTTLVGV